MSVPSPDVPRFVLSFWSDDRCVRVPFHTRAEFRFFEREFYGRDHNVERLGVVEFREEFYEGQLTIEGVLKTALEIGKCTDLSAKFSGEFFALVEELPPKEERIHFDLATLPFADEIATRGLTEDLLDVLGDWLMESNRGKANASIATWITGLRTGDQNAKDRSLFQAWPSLLGGVSTRDEAFRKSRWRACFLDHFSVSTPTTMHDLEELRTAPAARYLRSLQLAQLVRGEADSVARWISEGKLPPSVRVLQASRNVVFDQLVPRIEVLAGPMPLESVNAADYDLYFESSSVSTRIHFPELHSLFVEQLSGTLEIERSECFMPKLKRVFGWVTATLLEQNPSVEEVIALVGRESLENRSAYRTWLRALGTRLVNLRLVRVIFDVPNGGEKHSTGSPSPNEWTWPAREQIERDLENVKRTYPHAKVVIENGSRKTALEIARAWGIE
ncbi:MAG: hypothetical protein KBF88_06330 [Polyangiaceae bacterium]|nr:hypothetical protein [Polyangiaceae bacterium]